MPPMTSHERFKAMFEHREADRVPMVDSPWGTTIERWRAEGLPEDIGWGEYFEMDIDAGIGLDNSPHLPTETIEETDEYVTRTNDWGTTYKVWKHATSTPDFVDHTIVDFDSWRKIKKLITPDRDRIGWDFLKEHYATWRDEGRWLAGNMWFGFDVTHAWMVGTERTLMALVEDPDWIVDMWNHQLDTQLTLLDMLYDEGYTVDELFWCDDLGYKGTTFFSVPMYRELLKPVVKKACDWAHAHGVYTHLHSCGNVSQLIPEFIDAGVDALNPLEVKAGIDPVEVKKLYGDQIVLHGGINAMLWDDVDAITAEMKRVIPEVKKSGGYIFSSDHSVPDSVSFDNFRHIIELARELGAY
jgi:uroporphyrinogen decarboxylase